MKDQFDLDDLFEEPKSEAKPAPVEPAKPMVMLGDGRSPELVPNAIAGGQVIYTPECRVSVQRSGCFIPTTLILIALAVGFGLGALVGAWRSGGGDVEPNVDPVSGAYVAIFYQDADLQNYTPSQREFLNSVNTANWLEEHKVNWKKIDVDDKVDRLPEPFPIMAEKHRSKEPWIVIAAGKKFASEPIESNDQAMKLLQKWVK